MWIITCQTTIWLILDQWTLSFHMISSRASYQRSFWALHSLCLNLFVPKLPTGSQNDGIKWRFVRKTIFGDVGISLGFHVYKVLYSHYSRAPAEKKIPHTVIQCLLCAHCMVGLNGVIVRCEFITLLQVLGVTIMSWICFGSASFGWGYPTETRSSPKKKKKVNFVLCRFASFGLPLGESIGTMELVRYEVWQLVSLIWSRWFSFVLVTFHPTLFWQSPTFDISMSILANLLFSHKRAL